MSLSPVATSPVLSPVQLHQDDLSIAESSTDLKIEAIRDKVLKKANKEISSLDVQIMSAKIGRIVLLTIGIPGIVFAGLGLVPIIAAEKAVKPQIHKMSTERWILKNFPESLHDEEVRGKAGLIVERYSKKMQKAEDLDKIDYEWDSDGDYCRKSPGMSGYLEGKDKKVLLIRNTAEANRLREQKELHSFIEKKFYT